MVDKHGLIEVIISLAQTAGHLDMRRHSDGFMPTAWRKRRHRCDWSANPQLTAIVARLSVVEVIMSLARSIRRIMR
jgi:hypothetical protein